MLKMGGNVQHGASCSVYTFCVWRIQASSISARVLWPEFAAMQKNKPPRHVIAGPRKCHPLPEKKQPSTTLEWMTNKTSTAKVVGGVWETLWDGYSGNSAKKMHLVMFTGVVQPHDMLQFQRYGFICCSVSLLL